MNLYGYDAVWYADSSYHNTCGNVNTFTKFGVGAQIGTDGRPMQVNLNLPGYLQSISTTGKVLEYGECSQKSSESWIQRGYKNAQDDVSGFKCPNGGASLFNSVIYTPGMVKPYLLFVPKENDKIDMLNDVVILKQNERCDNQFFDQWFADVPGVNKRINTTLNFTGNTYSKYYIYDYSYNNGGYFPLDSINPLTREWVGPKHCNASIQPNGVCDQYGPQTLSIFCPPYNYQYAKEQVDFLEQNTAKLCTDWLNQGGPRAVEIGSGHSAAWQAAAMNGSLGMQHLRNYSFTMMGYAGFKYNASNQVPTPEVFEIAGDDDIWVFVDGVLVVDLGGTHLPAPGKVNIQVLALNNHGCHAGEPLASYTNCVGASDQTGWADDTWHHLHFFYANRQSDASDIYIRTSLGKRAPSHYSIPFISDVIVKVDENGISYNSMFMNVPLADSSLIAINNSNVPLMVVLHEKTDANGVKQTVVYGYYVTSMVGPINKGGDDHMYQFTGVVKDLSGNVIDSELLDNDQIAFNVPWSKGLEDDGNGGNYNASEWSQLMAWSQLMNFYVASSVGEHVDTFGEREMWGKVSHSGDEIVFCEE
ncbi:fibro-slime domain-containing protein [uncultured Fibrobacter sp.]|uniref:fibro-slime domain-containing protein n=1 Tax=uncultured Fibrobacter sp. TaxID=261512 RepID=UPI0025DFEEED|nr:fibro-slime domain-containing protein [uncultured Fibrobacter sp.]